MTEKDCQIVYLIATLRPKEEPEFLHTIGLEEKDVIVFRSLTTRENVKYQVIKYDYDEEEAFVKDLVDRKKTKYLLLGQIIIYRKSL